jgi:hypothetical protein
MSSASRAPNNQLQRAESSLKSQQLIGQSRNSRILWNPKAHYRFHNRPPLTFIASQINNIHTLRFYFRKIHFNIIHLSTPKSSKWPPSFQFTTLYVFVIFLKQPTCPTHLFLHFNILIYSEEYKSLVSSCNLVQSPFTSCP